MYEGRAKKFSREVWQQLCRYVEYGLDHATACQAINISQTTLYEWIKKGRDMPDRYPEHAEFYETWIAAESQFEAYHAGTIYKAAEVDWKASAHALERRRPKQWAKRTVIDTTWEERLAQMGKNPQEIMELLLAIIGSGMTFEEIMDGLRSEADGDGSFGFDDGDGDGSVSVAAEAGVAPADGASAEGDGDDR